MSAHLVRNANGADLSAIVTLHRLAFPNFLMTLLGPRFLRLYYSEVLAFQKRVFLVCEGSDGVVTGFASGVIDPPAFYAKFNAKKIGALLASASHWAIRPWIWWRLLESARKLSSRSAQHGHNDAELTSIAVDPRSMGTGVGALLLSRFLKASSALGARRVVLTTDAKDNVRVNEFYRRAGFHLERTIPRASGREMNEYVLVFSKENSGVD